MSLKENSFLQLFKQNEERKMFCFVFWVNFRLGIIIRYYMLLNVGCLCGQQMLNSRHFSNCFFRESFREIKTQVLRPVRGILM